MCRRLAQQAVGWPGPTTGDCMRHLSPAPRPFCWNIWAGDRHSMASLTISTGPRRSHISPACEAITLLIISDTRSAARLPAVTAGLSAKPVLIGYSFGGMIAGKLLGQTVQRPLLRLTPCL